MIKWLARLDRSLSYTTLAYCRLDLKPVRVIKSLLLPVLYSLMDDFLRLWEMMKNKYFIWGSRNFQLKILEVILLTPLLGLSADSVRMNFTVTNKMLLSNWINILQLMHGEMCFIFSPSSVFSSLIACSNIHKCNHLFFQEKKNFPKVQLNTVSHQKTSVLVSCKTCRYRPEIQDLGSY